MSGEAIGLIETVGMTAAIEAADVCLKSANISLVGYELTKGGGLVTIKIQGDVGAVKAAVDAANVSAGKINKVYSVHVIPRPAESLKVMIDSKETVGTYNKADIEEIFENPKEEKKWTCNLCHDPNCNRKKGMPRKLCIHYKEAEGEKNE